MRDISSVTEIQEDFGWIPDLLIAAFSNPIISFFTGIAVTLLIWGKQTKLAARIKVDEERRSLYRSFLQTWHVAVSINNSQERLDALVSLEALANEIRLLAQPELAASIDHCISAVKAYHQESATASDFTTSAGETVNASDGAYYEKNILIKKMQD